MPATDYATTSPRRSVVSGPEQFRLDELIRGRLGEIGDPCDVITDPAARYFGATLSERTLVSDGDATLAETRLEDWVTWT